LVHHALADASRVCHSRALAAGAFDAPGLSNRHKSHLAAAAPPLINLGRRRDPDVALVAEFGDQTQ
jgi:hypothetical protein